MIKSININNSEIEYLSFWNWKEPFIIIPWLSIKSVLLNEEAITEQFSKFSENFTVYLIDRIKEVPDNYSIENMAEDTYTVIKKLWLTDCNIYWVSQGWMIAQYVAINHPQIINTLTLWSTTYKTNENAKKIFSERIELAKQREEKKLIESFIKNLYCKETIKTYWAAIRDSLSNVTEKEYNKFIKLATPLLNFDIEKDVKWIKCKKFLLWSSADKIFWNDINALAEKLWCNYFLYDNYGHAVYDEAPDFFDKIYNFIIN